VSHDRYFVERLATKIIAVGHGEALVYPGTYPEYLWHKEHPAEAAQGSGLKAEGRKPAQGAKPVAHSPEPSRDKRKRVDTERRKHQRAAEALQNRIAALEARIAEREAAVRELEVMMSAPGFYDDREASKSVIDKHQALMWEVGDLISQWEALQEHAAGQTAES
jgi:ATP-binding cassette subfamily F protein 3